MPKRTLLGEVISNKGDKTVVVRVDRRVIHRKYKKTILQSKKYHAHDEANEYRVGDRVWIEECRPISKLKHWIVISGTGSKSAADHRPSNRDVTLVRPRNETAAEVLTSRNLNPQSLLLEAKKNPGGAFNALIDHLLPADAPSRIASLAFGELLATVLALMTTSQINDRIEKLLYDLDHSDKTKVAAALTKLSVIMPRLNVNRCLRDPELRATLYSVPDRLLTALSENLDSASAAKHAAFALVAAMYPEHYRGEILAADEETARADLELIFKKNHVTSFFTISAEAATDVARIEAKLWDSVPFKLAGAKPNLVRSSFFDGKRGLEIFDVKGAKAVTVTPVSNDKLLDGQHAGLTAVLKPDLASTVNRKVVVYFGKGDRIYTRELFDTDALFSDPSTPTQPENSQTRLLRQAPNPR
jgi:small subunit ribosomal protein S17